ncbi:MAG: polysaccharide deacetylase family protein [Ferruginibacter sp.]
MFYFIKTPWWLQRLYSNCIWHIPSTEKVIYLTFDDGPDPVATTFVLDVLKKYDAKATFFCIGQNVLEQPSVYERIVNEGHAVGNHTFNHLNGWKTSDDMYMENIAEAKKYIHSQLFRPPYGKATKFQLKLISGVRHKFKTIMWTVLSGDFDEKVTEKQCLKNVLNKTGKGSIVVFHDSKKAYKKIQFTLPKVLEYFHDKGYHFERIST